MFDVDPIVGRSDIKAENIISDPIHRAEAIMS